MTHPPLVLEDQHFFAQGSGRQVYRHPDHSNLVIKIQKQRPTKRFHSLRRLVNRNKRRFMPIVMSWVEIDEYAAIIARNQKVPPFCVQFRGFIDTTKGLGAMFDLVLTPDGEIAPTLTKFAANNPRTDQITAAIDTFWDDADEFGAVIWDPNLNNLLVQGSLETGITLILVDGLGGRTWIPLASMSQTVRRNAANKSRAAMKQAYDTIAQAK